MAQEPRGIVSDPTGPVGLGPLAAPAAGSPGQASRLPAVLSLDTLFVLLVAGAFAYLVLEGAHLPRGSGRYPVFIGSIGLVLVVLYIVKEVVQMRAARGQARERARILDIVYEVSGISRAQVWKRTAGFFGSFVVIIGGIWLLNFHVAIPLYLALYMRWFGRTTWRTALTTAVALELVIVVLYGVVIHTPWPESVVEAALRVSFQDLLGGPIHRLLRSI